MSDNTDNTNNSRFPYENYETLAEPLTTYYPTGEEDIARWAFQTVEKGSQRLSQMLDLLQPEMEVLVVAPSDWSMAPRDEDDEGDEEDLANPHPYWTDSVSPPVLVVPTELGAIFGEPTQAKLAFMLYHELTLAYLESDPAPWPEESPLWADEWQLKFAALSLAQQLNGQKGIVNSDLFDKYAEIFEPEEDGKTPITIRGFDWYDDTNAEDYLCYELLLEQFSADLLATYGPGVLPRFLADYRSGRDVLLSDEVTEMLGDALGPGGTEWLDNLTYF